MRKVDKLGRIVIPQELREKYGLTEGKVIDFFDVGDGITVKPYDDFCKICHSKLSKDATTPLCEGCIAKVVRSYNEGK